jgi:molybdenum cofactor cytidylyltransferase
VSQSSIAIIVLAAGASSRMGVPKQLLMFEGETLLRRSVRAALETRARAVVVVLGSDADAMREESNVPGALTVVNQSWPAGMSSSLRCGLRRALAAAEPDGIEAVIVMLCDQPFVTSKVIRRLVDAYRKGGALLVASAYEAGGEQTLGVPALFSRALFPELMALDGAEGARRIIARHCAEALSVGVPEAAFDVDTPADYRALPDIERSD